MNDAERKAQEATFHDRREHLRHAEPLEYERITRNQRFYAANRASKRFMDAWLREHCAPGRLVLDYCCGTGLNTLFMAECGADVVGIDISPESARAARARLTDEGLAERAKFVLTDAERTAFGDRTFDIILCNGVLHHLDSGAAFAELSRILKPGGRVFCVEALAHNPVFQLYRRLTPHMRTEWEADHILSRRQITLARQHFQSVETHFFHLTGLLAVPFRRQPRVFDRVLRVLDGFDRALLSLPGLRWWSWQCLFVLAEPRAGVREA
jgi:ubiquinone/menaquinone biosynthesis C-methylase UbiE